MRIRKTIMQAFAFAAAVAAVAAFTSTSVAYGRNGGSPAGGRSPWAGHDTSCTGTIGGVSTVTTISGDVTVPAGASCILNFVNVTGNVKVEKGGSLLVAGFIEPSTIRGNITADKCVSALLEGNVTVNGDVDVSNCTGTAISGFEGPGVIIGTFVESLQVNPSLPGGNFRCHDNAGPCEAWLGQIAHDVHIRNNGGTASDASLNTVDGDLVCEGNTVTPTHNHGFNWVTGKTKGQCGASFSTTTTSLGFPASSGMACASLAALPSSAFPVPNIVVTSATAAAATSTLPARCIVVLSYMPNYLSPVSGCHYHDNMQVQLPTAWNGNFFLQGENAGSLSNATAEVANGYADADDDEGSLTSDMALCGDTNGDQYFEDPGPNISAAYQANQITALVAKYVIAAYYGKNATYSFDGGCSGPGREAMLFTQSFPTYFDAVYSGAEGADFETTELPHIWNFEQFLNVYDTWQDYDGGVPLTPTPPATVPSRVPQAPEPLLYQALPTSDQDLFETALLQACDALDGVADGVIDNEPLCDSTFDPATAKYSSGGVTYPLQCPTSTKNATCLSPTQIQATKSMHLGMRPTDGRPLFAPAGATAIDHSDNQVFGYLYDGGWGTSSGVLPTSVGTATAGPGLWEPDMSFFVYASLTPADPTYNPINFNPNTDWGLLTRNMASSTISTSLDISKYIKLGHKIIWYHGTSDPNIPVLESISYYNGMAQQYGGLEKVQDFSRLYLVPNMGHCGGGPATDTFDMTPYLLQWVQNGVAPGPITASGVNFTTATYDGVGIVAGAPDNAPTTRSRPLCPYPQEARFTGSTTLVSGVPVATTPSQLAVATNYQCVAPSGPDPLEKIGLKRVDRDLNRDHDHDHDGDHDRW